jgi:pantoate--beta-alanine ligase
MKVFHDIERWRAHRAKLAQSPGFVPTMGALHEGHLSLVDRSRRENAVTVVSVFVNPAQFDDPSDLEAYPARIEADLERLATRGVDAVWLPDAAAIYPDDYRYRVTETELSRRWCGAHRPGHFDGVLTVVLRLLNLVRPARAYFGEKDWQQLQLVRGMAEAFFLDVEIVACPVVRERDGLAMSSRNLRLGDEARALAPRFAAVLRSASTAGAARDALAEAGFEVDYVDDIGDRRLAAVRLGDVRLIDNVAL